MRVTIFESGKPQQISPPDNSLGFFSDTDLSFIQCDYLNSDPIICSDDIIMTTATAVAPSYDRQMR